MITKDRFKKKFDRFVADFKAKGIAQVEIEIGKAGVPVRYVYVRENGDSASVSFAEEEEPTTDADVMFMHGLSEKEWDALSPKVRVALGAPDPDAPPAPYVVRSAEPIPLERFAWEAMCLSYGWLEKMKDRDYVKGGVVTIIVNPPQLATAVHFIVGDEVEDLLDETHNPDRFVHPDLD